MTRLPHTRRPHKRLAIGRKIQECLDDDRRRGLGPTTDEAYFQAYPEAEFRTRLASPADIHVANILFNPPPIDQFIWIIIRQLAPGKQERFPIYGRQPRGAITDMEHFRWRKARR